LVFRSQLGEDLLARSDPPGVSISDAASKRRIEGGKPCLTLVKKAKPFAQHFAL
jgi:hypothetical protein